MVKGNKAVVIVLVCLWFVVGCGQDKYDDVVDVNDRFVSVTEDYIEALNNAGNGEDVAKAMNQYMDGFKKLAPEMEKINKKYPDLASATDLPEKVKESQAKAAKVGMDFATSFMKSMKYMMDPEVAAAQKRMGEVMKSLHGKE